jgi:hypothetical protein
LRKLWQTLTRTSAEENQWHSSPIGIGDTLQGARFPLGCIFALKILHIEKSFCSVFAIHPLGSDRQIAEG